MQVRATEIPELNASAQIWFVPAMTGLVNTAHDPWVTGDS